MYLPYKFKKLSINFDADGLMEDLSRVQEDWWIRYEFDGTAHDVVPLMTSGGSIWDSDGSANHRFEEPFLSTEYLGLLPYLKKVLNSFTSPPTRCRLMRIGAGETVLPHQDRNPHWNDKVRLHVPIVTDPRVLFHMWSERPERRAADRETVHMKSGEAWVFNSWYFHAVSNESTGIRVHLVGDFRCFGGLDELLFEGVPPEDVDEAKGFRYTPANASY